MNTVRVLTVSDLHQLPQLYAQLRQAVESHRPDVVAIVGDALEAIVREEDCLSVKDAALQLASLPVTHLVFTPGHHEDGSWAEFVAVWPHDLRALTALYGTAYQAGPLTLIGFPCRTGCDGPWRRSLPETGNVAMPDAQPCRKALPVKTRQWLSPLLDELGSAGLSLWLMHEPPVSLPICRPEFVCHDWARAVWQHRPMLVVSGHDQHSPLQSNLWKGWLGATCCLNVGQTRDVLHYAVLDFYFETDVPARAIGAMAEAFPWRKP